jgi:hypothetical protein
VGPAKVTTTLDPSHLPAVLARAGPQSNGVITHAYDSSQTPQCFVPVHVEANNNRRLVRR